MPEVSTIVLWFVLERQDHIEDENGCPQLEELDMLMLKNRLDQWKKEVRLQGLKPLVFDFPFLTAFLTISFETRYVTSTSATPATTSYITCCFVVNVDMNTAIAQIQKVVRIHCGTFLLPRMPI